MHINIYEDLQKFFVQKSTTLISLTLENITC